MFAARVCCLVKYVRDARPVGRRLDIDPLVCLLHYAVAERNVAHDMVVADAADREAEPARGDALDQEVLRVLLDCDTVVLVPDRDVVQPGRVVRRATSSVAV